LDGGTRQQSPMALNSTPHFAVSKYARLAGCAYLAIILLGLFGEAWVRGTLLMPGDAQATLNNIAAAQNLWRAGIAGDLLMHVLDAPLIVFFYLLLKPVSQALALVATVLNIVQTCVLVANKLTLVVPLLVIENAAQLNGSAQSTWTSSGHLAIQLHGHGFAVGLIFFGFACLIRGHLIFKSTCLPKGLGLLLAIAGACYLVNSFALLLTPSLASVLFPAILVPAFLGELALCFWLMVKGVDGQA
jgi:Domain of unknown function (DUF4386)